MLKTAEKIKFIS